MFGETKRGYGTKPFEPARARKKKKRGARSIDALAARRRLGRARPRRVSARRRVPLSRTCGLTLDSRAPLLRSTNDPSLAFLGDGAPPLLKLRSFLRMMRPIVNLWVGPTTPGAREERLAREERRERTVRATFRVSEDASGACDCASKLRTRAAVCATRRDETFPRPPAEDIRLWALFGIGKTETGRAIFRVHFLI